MLLREVPREICTEGKGKYNYAQKRGKNRLGKRDYLEDVSVEYMKILQRKWKEVVCEHV